METIAAKGLPGLSLLGEWRVNQDQNAAGETPDVGQRQVRSVVDLLEQVLTRPCRHGCQQEVELVNQVVRHEDLVQRPLPYFTMVPPG